MSTYRQTANIYRSDYDPESSLHVIRMPSHVYESLRSLVQASIKRQLDIFRASDIAELALFTNDILNWGSATIRLEDDLQFSPDIQFAFKQSKYPSLIIEIAYLQSIKENRKSLPRLAEKYILHSNGNIQMVIGITIEYNSHREPPFLPFKGNLSLWQPSIVQDGRQFLERGTIINDEILDPYDWFHRFLLTQIQEFRSKDGHARNAGQITIPLSTWAANESEVPPIVKEHAISLSYYELAGWLQTAKEIHNQAELQTERAKDLPAGVCKRRLEITPPPETLSPSDEERFTALEKNDEKKALEGKSKWL